MELTLTVRAVELGTGAVVSSAAEVVSPAGAEAGSSPLEKKQPVSRSEQDVANRINRVIKGLSVN